jgi:hypothetical protein
MGAVLTTKAAYSKRPSCQGTGRVPGPRGGQSASSQHSQGSSPTLKFLLAGRWHFLPTVITLVIYCSKRRTRELSFVFYVLFASS